MKHVAVLMGGWSAERPVSLNSGRGCADALEASGYRVTRIDVDRSIADTLARLKPDVAFNALHGVGGEDGTIQGVLEILRIPYTHSGRAVLGARNAEGPRQDRLGRGRRARRAGAGDRPARGRAPPRDGAALRPEAGLRGLVVRRGDRQGGSRCTRPRRSGATTGPTATRCSPKNSSLGKELTCAVMGERVFDIIEIEPISEAFYGYDAKYAKGGSRHILPANLKPKYLP